MVNVIAIIVRRSVRRSEAMLIFSMSVSVDGFIADREGAFGWSAPSEELFRFHTALVASSAAICWAAGSTKR